MDEEWKNLPSLPYSKFDLGRIALSSLIMTYSKLVKMSSEKHIVLPSDDPLLNISATKAAEEIRTGKLKSYDLVSAYLNRIRDVNHFINAVTEVFEASALNKAKEVDDYLEKIRTDPEEIEKLKSEKPLLGLPISIKHSFDYKGYRNVCGLTYRRHLPPAAEHSVAVERVINAGAIPICYTNVPGGCMAFETDNPVYGRTNNPHDTRVTSGGSSGGEGALITAQGSLFGIGSDLAGSIRVPSSLNGIYGFKTGKLTCPSDGHEPNLSLNEEDRGVLAVGPMCRYAEDLPLLHQVLGGRTIATRISVLKPSKVFFSIPESRPVLKVADYIKDNINGVSDYLSEAYETPKQEFDIGKDILELTVLFLHSFFKPKLDCRDLLLPNKQFNVFKEFFKGVLGTSEISILNLSAAHGATSNLTNKSVEEAERHIKVIKKHFENTLGEDGILIFPGLPDSHYFHNGSTQLTGAYTVIFNALGLPSLSVPCGRCKQGYPTSVQIAGSHGSEPLLMAAAQKMEERFGGWVKPIPK
ncbi:unnamed protein product [Bursaphelenchus xylophilus]|uniref:(pine wood nematode) hypothetical protein n=1 Tax=Bursaphelenchus xylophilus TaxID=6326 RepID=A0A1I7S9F0_BURXY|nr:unnamed protein product [Bursaphelenchus xylophilus]CAG9100580.1 unnamed protein product [Bursaphelenchus xylophilus]